MLVIPYCAVLSFRLIYRHPLVAAMLLSCSDSGEIRSGTILKTCPCWCVHVLVIASDI